MELKNETQVLQKHKDKAWKHFEQACKLAEYKDNETQRLNTEVWDWMEQLVAYKNLYKEIFSTFQYKPLFASCFMNTQANHLLQENNLNLGLEHCVRSIIPNFYSYETFYNIFILRDYQTKLFTITFCTFKEAGLGDFDFDILILNHTKETVRKETGFTYQSYEGNAFPGEYMSFQGTLLNLHIPYPP